MNKNQYDLDTQQATLELILAARKPNESTRATCKRLAKQLNIHPKYLYQIAAGYKKAGDTLAKSIKKLLWTVTNTTPPAYKPRLVISYDPEEETLRERHQILSNNVRKNALDHFIRVQPGDKFRSHALKRTHPQVISVYVTEEQAKEFSELTNDERIHALGFMLIMRNMSKPLPEHQEKILKNYKIYKQKQADK